MFDQLKTTIAGVLLVIGMTTASLAQDIPAPTDAAVLTVSGDISLSNVGNTLALDIEGLAALGTVSVETTTIWTEGVQTFEGVPLKTVVDLIGAEDGVLLASAINDYTIEVPVADAVEDGPIIAFRMNGQEMSVRDKGPLWIIYPYDSNADYRAEVIYSRSIWQLDRIEVVQ